MSQHTPGPWTSQGKQTKHGEGLTVTSQDGISIIAEIPGGLPFNEIEANARLIAAAPEMRLDLVMITEHIESWLTVLNGPEYASVREDMRREVATIRALLAKVEGHAH